MDGITAMTWLILIPMMASPVIYLIGRISVRNGEGNPSRWLAFLALAATDVCLFFAARAYMAGGAVEIQAGAIDLQLDGISLLLAAAVLVLATLVSLFSVKYMAGENGEEKFYALLVMMVGTIIGLGCANDLFNLWVWFEAMAISSYMLVAFYREQGASLEAGVKYLVQSSAGSVLVLLGIALVFSQAGTLSLEKIRVEMQTPNLALLAAGALFMIGFGVKTAMVPMHTWLPDAHSQAPSGISAMLSGIVIEAGLVALLRAVGSLAGISHSWGVLLMAFGAANILLGNLMALRQTQVKRMLAYSSLSHVGYILIGLGVTLVSNTPEGAAGSFFHLLVHTLMKGLAFLAAGALLYSLHLAKGDHHPLILDDLNGAARRYPVVAFTLSLAVFSLGGLPPLAGFMSKWQIFVAGVQTQNTLIILLVAFAALNSVLSLGYYAPLVNRMYRYQPSLIVQEGAAIPRTMGIPLVLIALALVVIGFYPALVSWLTQPAAASLLAAFGG
jgi:proton-translocating NADH-quinone oxidoreductase chain N